MPTRSSCTISDLVDIVLSTLSRIAHSIELEGSISIAVDDTPTTLLDTLFSKARIAYTIRSRAVLSNMCLVNTSIVG